MHILISGLFVLTVFGGAAYAAFRHGYRQGFVRGVTVERSKRYTAREINRMKKAGVLDEDAVDVEVDSIKTEVDIDEV